MELFMFRREGFQLEQHQEFLNFFIFAFCWFISEIGFEIVPRFGNHIFWKHNFWDFQNFLKDMWLGYFWIFARFQCPIVFTTNKTFCSIGFLPKLRCHLHIKFKVCFYDIYFATKNLLRLLKDIYIYIYYNYTYNCE